MCSSDLVEAHHEADDDAQEDAGAVVGHGGQGLLMISGQRVSGDSEEALNLSGVKIDAHVPVGARDFDHVGHQPSRNRDPRLILFIRPRVAEIRDHGGNPRRRIEAQRLNQTSVPNNSAVRRAPGTTAPPSTGNGQSGNAY